MSDELPPMGSICHHEIPSPDLEKQQAFYAEVFGWTFEVKDDHYLLFRDGLTGGGLDAKAEPSDKGAVCVIAVEEVNATLARIRDCGGRPLSEKERCGESDDWGFYAYFQDPCGNRLGVWSRA